VMSYAAAGKATMMIPFKHAHIADLTVPSTRRYKSLAAITHVPLTKQLGLQGWLKYVHCKRIVLI